MSYFFSYANDERGTTATCSCGWQAYESKIAPPQNLNKKIEQHVLERHSGREPQLDGVTK